MPYNNQRYYQHTIKLSVSGCFFNIQSIHLIDLICADRRSAHPESGKGYNNIQTGIKNP